MKSPITNLVMSLSLVVIALAAGAGGIYFGEIDDAPGAILIGIVLVVVALTFAVKIARRKY